MRDTPQGYSYDAMRPRAFRNAPPSIMTLRLLAAGALALVSGVVVGCGSSGATNTIGAESPTTTPSTATVATTTPATLPGNGKPPVAVGWENDTEQFVLGQLYYQALQAEGFTVTINQNLGPISLRLQQLQNGGKGDGVDMYPEYLDVWNSQVAGDTHSFTKLSRSYAAAQNFAIPHGLELLNPTPFSDTSGIGVTVSFAQQNGLRTIRDLAKVAATLTLGGPPQFQTDQMGGLPAMETAYGFSPAAYKPLELGSQYQALDQGAVQAAYVNTTDGELTSENYRLLTDTKKAFGVGNVVPVVTLKVLEEEGPAFAATINRVSALLTMPVIRELNAEADPALAGKSPAGVASRFLADHGLIPPSSATS